MAMIPSGEHLRLPRIPTLKKATEEKQKLSPAVSSEWNKDSAVQFHWKQRRYHSVVSQNICCSLLAGSAPVSVCTRLC